MKSIKSALFASILLSVWAIPNNASGFWGGLIEGFGGLLQGGADAAVTIAKEAYKHMKPGVAVDTWNKDCWRCQTNAVSLPGLSECPEPQCCPTQWKERPDGCSVPVDVPVLRGEFFRQACDAHDLCYSSPGHSRQVCDDWFLDHMLTLCADDADYEQICVGEAIAFYVGVRVGGAAGFTDGQAWVKEHCTLLPPLHFADCSL
ncbi:MAG: hypothetical protein KJO08_08210 [Gammaproteobacteria bacterium]|nr:hypothetical protein [Gammaproteobacteria bacterium]